MDTLRTLVIWMLTILFHYTIRYICSYPLTECPSPRSEVALEPLYRRLECPKGNQEALDGPSQLEVGALPDF